MKKDINDFSLEELKLIRSYIGRFINIEAPKKALDMMISDKETEKEESLNQKFNIELMKKVFDSELFSIIQEHEINNIQDLIDSDTDKWNITTQRKIELEEAKSWYDFDKSMGKK